jgi:hypothetical protein
MCALGRALKAGTAMSSQQAVMRPNISIRRSALRAAADAER